MVGTRNRTKLRGELEMMEKFMKEKKSEVERVSMETPGEETEEKEAARIKISGEFESFMEEMLRKYTEEIEKLRNEIKKERRAWK